PFQPRISAESVPIGEANTSRDYLGWIFASTDDDRKNDTPVKRPRRTTFAVTAFCGKRGGFCQQRKPSSFCAELPRARPVWPLASPVKNSRRLCPRAPTNSIESSTRLVSIWS